MKILFLTVSAGEGHNSMCRSLTSYFENHFPDVETKTVDLFKGRDKLRTFLVNKGYFTICRYAIHFSNAVFEHTKKVDYRTKKLTPSNFFLKKAMPFIENNINEFKPDIIFCAHTFSGMAVQILRRKGNEVCKNAKVFSIVSDFDVAPCTELLNEIDYIFVPSLDFSGDLLKRGFKQEQIVETGIPINEKFSIQLDKDEMRKKLGLSNMFTVLITGGGVGFGNTYKLVKNLLKSKNQFQIVTICGKNKKQFNKLETLKKQNKLTNLTNFGFVNNVNEIMSASDIIVAKLGGLMTSEAFSREIPIIATKKLPFQEVDNKNYLVGKNACLYISNNKTAYKLVDRIIEDEELFSKMKESVKKIKKPFSCKNICEFMLKTTENQG